MKSDKIPEELKPKIKHSPERVTDKFLTFAHEEPGIEVVGDLGSGVRLQVLGNFGGFHGFQILKIEPLLCEEEFVLFAQIGKGGCAGDAVNVLIGRNFSP